MILSSKKPCDGFLNLPQSSSGNLVNAMCNPCMDAMTLVGRSQRPIYASKREATPSPYRMGFFLPSSLLSDTLHSSSPLACGALPSDSPQTIGLDTPFKSSLRGKYAHLWNRPRLVRWSVHLRHRVTCLPSLSTPIKRRQTRLRRPSAVAYRQPC